VQAAIDVLDEKGVAGVSMRRVAAKLDTSAASLYAHVSSKDQLLELVFDELVGRVPLPQPDPLNWREQIHQMVRDLHQVLTAHRDAALAGLGRVPTTPKVLLAAEALSAVMLAGGLSERVVAIGLDQLILFVCASAFERGLIERSGMTPDEIASYFAQVHAFYEHLPADHFPALARIAPKMTGHDADTRFTFTIGVLIAGMEAASSPPRTPKRTTDPQTRQP
jgi:AcrR family transcriptional regulator